MAATATTVVDFKRVNDFKIFRFSTTTINAGSSRHLSIAIPRRGTIKGIAILCPTSTDYDVTVSQKVDVDGATPDKDILYQVTAIVTKFHRVTNLEIPYFNNDVTPDDKLYVTIKNDDIGNPTGAVSIEVTQVMKGGA